MKTRLTQIVGVENRRRQQVQSACLLSNLRIAQCNGSTRTDVEDMYCTVRTYDTGNLRCHWHIPYSVLYVPTELDCFPEKGVCSPTQNYSLQAF